MCDQIRVLQAHRPVWRLHHVSRPAVPPGAWTEAAVPGASSEGRRGQAVGEYRCPKTTVVTLNISWPDDGWTTKTWGLLKMINGWKSHATTVTFFIQACLHLAPLTCCSRYTNISCSIFNSVRLKKCVFGLKFKQRCGDVNQQWVRKGVNYTCQLWSCERKLRVEGKSACCSAVIST